MASPAATALMCFYLANPGHQICAQPLTVSQSDGPAEHAIILMCATNPEAAVLHLPECGKDVPPATVPPADGPG